MERIPIHHGVGQFTCYLPGFGGDEPSSGVVAVHAFYPKRFTSNLTVCLPSAVSIAYHTRETFILLTKNAESWQALSKGSGPGETRIL